jgi:hypothetical protein
MQDYLIIGEVVKQCVLNLAKLLILDAVPGFVVIGLVLGFAGVIGSYFWQVRTRSKALEWLQKRLRETKTPTEFTARVHELDAVIREKGLNKQYRSISNAWSEYRETMIPYGEGDSRILRNSVRPSAFFNTEDLRFGPGFYRIVPGLFVTIGLFLTFLGLIAALSVVDVQGDPVQMKKGLESLLKAASAKFIMSLTGLFCSILFTIVLRMGLSQIERDIHITCHEIEKRLSFLSLEDIAVDQLAAMREQREHFRTIGMELVAEIAHPLRHELPQVISDSISNAISPVLHQVQQAGTSGVGTMIEDLSSRFSSDVAQALSTAGKSIEAAGDRIANLAERMDASSGNMNREAESTIARLAATLDSMQQGLLNSAQTTQSAFTQGADRLLSVMSETLQDIRANTGEGARAMGEAARDMRSAAQSFKEELNKASEASAQAVAGQMASAGAAASDAVTQASAEMLAAFGKSAGDIASLSGTMSEKLARDVLSPIDTLSGRLTELNQKVAINNDEMRKLAEGVRSGADASATAAGSFRSASSDLVAAASPIRTAVDVIARGLADLKDTTQQTAESLKVGVEATVKSASAALESASAVLGGEQQAIQAALAGVGEAVTRMKDQGQRLDDIDSKLAAAFEMYSQQVASAMDLMVEHVRKMQGEFGPALDTMREIVDQAEKFTPTSRASR